MTIIQMFGQSGVLTVLGMGVVFSFLVILVISVSITGKIFRALEAGKNASLLPEEASSPFSGGAGGITAAITAAVNEYRKNNT